MSILSDLINIDLSLSPMDESPTGDSEMKRKLALAMLARGQDTSQIKSTAQGINSVLQSMLGAYNLRRADKADLEAKKKDESLLSEVFGGGSQGSGTKGAGGFTTSSAGVSPSGGVMDNGAIDASDPLALIKKEEGFAPVAKWDVRQFSGGYGSKAAKGETFDEAKADAYLRRDAAGPMAWVEKNAPNATPAQKAALISFGYNLGEDDLEKLKPDIQAGNWERVGQRVLSFNKALNKKTGKLEPLDGLTSRRQREAALLTGAGGAMPEQASGAAITPASARGGQDAQRALMLFRSSDPRVRAIGQAMLQKIATKEAEGPEKPIIVEIPSDDGGKVPMVLNRTTNKLEPISSIIAGGAKAASSAFMPADGSPEVIGSAEMVDNPFQQATPAAQPSLPPQASMPSMLPGGDELPAEFIGEVGASGAKPSSGVVASSPSQAMENIPSGAMVGPEWRGKTPEGMVQRRTSDGRPLYDARRQPLFEPKSESEARGKTSAAKQAEAANLAKVGKQFSGGIDILERLPQDFGKEAFERSIGPWQATTGQTEDPQSGIFGTGVSVNSIGQNLARGWAEVQQTLFGGAEPTEVRDRVETQMKNLAAVMKPLVRKEGEGAWSDKDQENLEKQIGSLTRSRSMDEYYRRIEDIRETTSKVFLMDEAPRRAQQPRFDAPARADQQKTSAEDIAARVREYIASQMSAQPQQMPPQPQISAAGTGLPQELNPLLQAMIKARMGQ